LASVNRVILIGNLGRDPETRNLNGSDAIASFSIATTDNWKDKNGQKQERTEWHRISAFGKLAEIAGQYLKKGSSVYVEGRLQTRKWQDKEGNERNTTEVVIDRLQMLGGRSAEHSDSDASSNKRQQSSSDNRQSSAANNSGFDGFDDDIPF